MFVCGDDDVLGIEEKKKTNPYSYVVVQQQQRGMTEYHLML